MLKLIKNGYQFSRQSVCFLYQGFKEGILKEHLSFYFNELSFHLSKFYIRLFNPPSQEAYTLLQKRVQGLHSLLPDNKNFSYSILIEIDGSFFNLSNVSFLESSLLSALNQSAPNLEVLLGFRNSPSKEVLNLMKKFEKNHPQIRILDFSMGNQNTPLHNLIASEAKGNYLFFLKQEDWIRPDLLYRYELYLRKMSSPEKCVLNSFENQINKNGWIIPGSKKKETLHFPYIFHPLYDIEGFLIPKSLWFKTTGFKTDFKGSEVANLVFQLDLANAHFHTIPIPLYSKRRKTKKKNTQCSNPSSFIEAVSQYSKNKNLNWHFQLGYSNDTFRAIPQNSTAHLIQVIIPFKDQKNLTLKSIDSILKQKGVEFKITAIDNNSKDRSIEEIIKQKGGEVLRIEEPFNYSRLNNLAVKKTKIAKECDLLLFLNNDVELDSEALQEMVRWIDQPQIGIVGARLHYPNGKLQHGGIRLNPFRLEEKIFWEEREKFIPYEKMQATKSITIVDAVTAACALIKKEIFLSVGGFDEIWYPIAYSDTDLALKLSKIGLKALYTPYAHGIHHESISRKSVIEDAEESRWLHTLTHP